MEGKVSQQTQKCTTRISQKIDENVWGGGKHGNIPPKEFIPHSLLAEAGKCGKCDETFESDSDLKIHILNEHNADVKMDLEDCFLPAK